MKAVTIPTGSMRGEAIVLATVSAASSSIEPISIDDGIKKRWSEPIVKRAMWGARSPINPIVPTKATGTAVRSEAMARDVSLRIFVFTPRLLATSSPARIAL